MKGKLPFLLSLFIVTSVFAQNKIELKSGEDRIADIKEYDFRTNMKANRTTRWFNMYQDQKSISSAYSTYLDFLWPDSTVMWVNTSGANFVWKCAQGQVFDPTSNYWSILSVTVSEDATYRLDSIAIPYAYRRIQQAKADTLLVQIVDANNMGYVPDPNWTVPQSYCRPEYDSIQRKAVGAIKEFKIPLTDADTAVSVSRIIQLDVGIDVLAGDEIAATVHYIPGNPYKTGDTLTYTGTGPGSLNSFAIWNGKDANKTVDMYHYNHSLFINNSVAHNVNTNGWNGRYIPGVAWNSGNYYSNIYFLITYDDFSSIEDHSGELVMNIGPNPTSDFINATYDFGTFQSANIEFYDVTGRMIHSERLENNSTNVSIDVSGWEEGMYIHRLIVNNELVGSGRIVVK